MADVTLITMERLNNLQEELAVAKAEAEKFQAINDELIERILHVVRTGNDTDYKHALEVKNRELEEQAKYSAELRSYVSSLQAKVRDLNKEVQHHKEKHTELQFLLNKERSKPVHDLKREKDLLDRRVTELYNAIDKIDDIVSDVL